MDFDELSLKLSSVLRHAGLAHVPRFALVGVFVLACILACTAVWRFWPSSSDTFAISSASTSQSTSPETRQSSESKPASQKILVDIEGAVISPGLYTLDDGARVGDAVNAAGGLAADASSVQINLARKLSDGEQVYVPTTGEGERINQQGYKDSSGVAQGAGNAPSGKININTASAEELQSLSGIGPSLAERIIDYRESNGRFSSVDDLQNVSGIGKTRLANIKDKICV